jgi:pimeloyl-[acyl-carrier protein] methyl ester esterase
VTLHCESLGAGPDMVLVHGWGWHGGVWSTVAAHLAQHFRVWIPDLPGHGRSRDAAMGTLSDVVEAVHASVPASATWVGWSLSALGALSAASAGLVRRLVLVSPTPRFVATADWAHGVSVDWMRQFSTDVAADSKRALERFASLHLAATGNDRLLLRRLRTELFSRELPSPEALRDGLAVLEQTDFRGNAGQLDVPTLIVHGAQDQLVPCAAGEWLAHKLPRSQWLRIDAAGHAPFLSHTDQFVDAVRAFVYD